MKDILYLSSAAFKIMVLRKPVPLAASWRITNKCNYRCSYCGYWAGNPNEPELTTGQVFKIIDQLSSAGIRKIGFTGGEPLIRDDFGGIVNYCYEKGFSTAVNTNGSLIEKHIKELDKLKRINLSLDGPKNINDSIRGRGAFDNVMQAIKIARQKNVRLVELTAVLSNVNINSIEYLIDLAASQKVKINFQATTPFILGSKQKNPLAPRDSEFKKAISMLLKARRFNKYIGNSAAGLKYIARYPGFQPIRCAQGVIVARISVDGALYRCDSRSDFKNKKYGYILDAGFDKARKDLKPFICNTGCGCAKAVELNHAMAGNIGAILNIISSA